MFAAAGRILASLKLDRKNLLALSFVQPVRLLELVAQVALQFLRVGRSGPHGGNFCAVGASSSVNVGANLVVRNQVLNS
jgi:hypothetical protein